MRLTVVLFIGSLLHASTGLAQDDLTRDHVVIVLDASGSMKDKMRSGGQQKMRAAKDAIWQVLQRIPATTHVGLACFGGNVGEDAWLYPLGPRDDARLKAAIEQPRADGATPLGRFIKIGADRLLEARAQEFGYGTYRLLLVTDGEATDQSAVERYTPEVIARGITVDVIGVAMDKAHTLATKVHSYRRADDPQSLARALDEIFAEVGGGQTDEHGEDAFALIAPLPDGLVQAVLRTIATADNEPIDRPVISGRKAPADADGSGPAPSGGGTTTGVAGTVRTVLGTACMSMVLLAIFAGVAVARALGRGRR